MSEEIKNATTVVPRSIIYGLLMNGTIGFATLIATLFCIGDLEAISETSFTYPFIEIYVRATKSKGGSAVMVALILIVGLGLDIGIMAAASRMLWSFARDRGVPGWRYISQVQYLVLHFRCCELKGPGIRSTAVPRSPSLLSLPPPFSRSFLA